MSDVRREVVELRQQADRLIQQLDHILGRIRAIEKAAGVSNDFTRLGKRASKTLDERVTGLETVAVAHHHRLAKLEGQPTSGERENADRRKFADSRTEAARALFRRNGRSGAL